MYEMKIEDNQPLLRNGTAGWSKPVIDEKGNFFTSQTKVVEEIGVCAARVSDALAHGKKLSEGRTLRWARVSDVKAHLGDQVKLHEDTVESRQLAKRNAHRRRLYREAKEAGKGSGKTTAKKAAAKKSTKSTKKSKKGTGGDVHTIIMSGQPTPLDRNNVLIFEGHEFTGGPAVMRIPGFPDWTMIRPTKDEFPPELRDNCRWS